MVTPLKEGELNEYGLPYNPRAIGYIAQGFPAPGLRRTVRHITGHDAEGKEIFLSTDCGDHHLIMGEQQALSNIVYSTQETPVDINDDVDVKHAKENVVRINSHIIHIYQGREMIKVQMNHQVFLLFPTEHC